jgi:hypothetical protein
MNEIDANNIFGKSINLWWDLSLLRFNDNNNFRLEINGAMAALEILKESIGREHKIKDSVLNKQSCDCFLIKDDQDESSL